MLQLDADLLGRAGENSWPRDRCDTLALLPASSSLSNCNTLPLLHQWLRCAGIRNQ